MDAKINNHSIQDLFDLGFLQVFWLMFPLIGYFQLSVVRFTSWSLKAEDHDKTSLGELTLFLGCIFFMAYMSGFTKEEYWSSKPVSMMEGAISLRFYSSSSSNLLANQFCFHPLTTTCSHGGWIMSCLNIDSIKSCHVLLLHLEHHHPSHTWLTNFGRWENWWTVGMVICTSITYHRGYVVLMNPFWYGLIVGRVPGGSSSHVNLIPLVMSTILLLMVSPTYCFGQKL